MASGNFVLDKGYDAAAQILKYRAVKFSAAQTVTPITGATDKVAGVEQFGALTAEIAKGKGASIRMAGITEMEASEAIAVGDLVAITTDGRARIAIATSRQIGLCVGHPSGVAGDRVSVLLALPGTIVA